jgi:transcription-repair coupling factor (superfamily II helicase)
MYCQLLEEAVRQLKNESKPTTPEAHVDIGVTAFIPKTYIPGDRPRMDVYRRLTRCTSIEMLYALEQDIKDAFGEPPRQVVVLLALTELKLLAGHFGVESIIRKPPDVVLTVSDAGPAQKGLTGAPGSLRVIDASTVYLRMPGSFMESETLLMVLRNLMKQAYEREKNGDGTPLAGAIAAALPQAPAPAKAEVEEQRRRKQVEELEKLSMLLEQGILNEQEFESAKKRLLAKR